MGKRIILLSLQDHTGSGYRMAEAVGLNTYHFVEYMVMMDDFTNHIAHKYPFMLRKKKGVTNSWEIHKRMINHAQKLIDDCDIIHLKGDELPRREGKIDNFYGLKIPLDKPRIISVGGSYFRRGKSNVSMPQHPIRHYVERFDFRSALTPDLNYPEFKAEYIPHPYDCKPIANIWQPREIPLIVHDPSGNDKKGTSYFMKALKYLEEEGYKFEVDIIEKVTNTECLERKSKATIFFNEISDKGWLGNSGIEAMAMGIPTTAYLSDIGLAQSNIKDCAIINCGNTAESLYKTLKDLLDHSNTYMQELSNKTKAYCNREHSYETLGKRWGDIYDSL